MTLFGGSPSQAHWFVGLRYKLDRNEGSKEQRIRRDAERSTLRAKQIKTEQYFRFAVKDEAGKAKQRALAEAEAARIEAATGIKMEICEGSFL